MSNPDRPSKIVVVLSKELEPGRALNAASHAVLGLGSLAEDGRLAEEFEVIDYKAADAGGFLASKLPLIVLRAKPGHLRRLLGELEAAGVTATAFHSGMVEGNWEDQLERSAATAAADLDLFAVAAIGAAADIDPLTKRCSLY